MHKISINKSNALEAAPKRRHENVYETAVMGVT